MLIEILSNYRAYKQCELILVFDAYKVQGNPGSISQFGGIYVVYTKEAETADAYIEKVTLELGKRHRVRVATSDALEQIIILAWGAAGLRPGVQAGGGAGRRGDCGADRRKQQKGPRLRPHRRPGPAGEGRYIKPQYRF